MSNFTVDHLQQLLEVATVHPAVNQVEVHPRFQQVELLEFCKREGIAVTAYGSLGSGSTELLQSEEVRRVAKAVHRSSAQVLLRWGLEKGCAIIPKSVRKERIQEFAESELLSWRLTEEHMDALDALPKTEKYCWDPQGVA